MSKGAALFVGALVIANAYAEPEKATEGGLLYGRPCAVTFEQKGFANGVPRWYAVIDRHPADPSFARGNFVADLIYTAHAIGADGITPDDVEWETTVGTRDAVRVILGFDHARREGGRRLRVNGVTLKSCRELTGPNGEP